MRWREHSIPAGALVAMLGIASAGSGLALVVNDLLSSRATLFIEPLTLSTALALFVCLPALALLAVGLGWMLYTTAHRRGLHLPMRHRAHG